MCETHRRIESSNRTRAVGTPNAQLAPSAAARAVISDTKANSVRVLEAPQTQSQPANRIKQEPKANTPTKVAPRPQNIESQPHPAITELAQLSAEENRLRDQGTLNQNLFDAAVLTDLGRKLNLRGIDLTLSGSPNRAKINDAAQVVRRALLQRVFAGNHGAMVSAPKPDVLK